MQNPAHTALGLVLGTLLAARQRPVPSTARRQSPAQPPMTVSSGVTSGAFPACTAP
jgi:hypothetical protein